MTNGQRTVTALLAVVAVLLGLNLIVGGSRPAAAQGPPQPEPKVVHATADFGVSCGVENFIQRHYIRFWDDGTIDITTRCVNARNCLDLGDTELTCGTTIIVPGY